MVIEEGGNSSPVMSYNTGSVRTSLQTSLINSAVKSRTSLCLKLMKPPFGQDKAWFMLKAAPHTHLDGNLFKGRLYRIYRASQKDCFSRRKLCFFSGNADSQLEAPFSMDASRARSFDGGDY